jgi:PAS domain S-box-containing protein
MTRTTRRRSSAAINLLLVGILAFSLSGFFVDRVFYTGKQEKWDTALRASNTGTWYWDLKTGKVEWNETSYAIFGTDKASFDGTYKGFESRIVESDRQRVDGIVNRALEEKGVYQTILRIKTNNGEERLVLTSGMVSPSGKFMAGTHKLVDRGRFLQMMSECCASDMKIEDFQTGLNLEAQKDK